MKRRNIDKSSTTDHRPPTTDHCLWPLTTAYDVVILGGGPAGCATALSLRAQAPALSVLLIEASGYDRPRLGEVLPAIARTFLDHLGIWESFQAESFQTVHSTASVWGNPRRSENHFIYGLHGAGWHLDRRHFDRFLARQAEGCGVEMRLATRVETADQMTDGWGVRLADGAEIKARFLVDATGRRAVLARKMGAQARSFDRLAGFARFFTPTGPAEPGTLIEAFSEGWWYTASTGNVRIVTCMTDTDIARQLGLQDERRWLELLFETTWIKKSVGAATPQGSPIVAAANSVRLEPVVANGWLAVGDAAAAFDPLSAQGIVKALRAGIFASYAIADFLDKADATGLARYERFVHREFNRYRQLHAEYCAQERRWPESGFWSRRQGKQS